MFQASRARHVTSVHTRWTTAVFPRFGRRDLDLEVQASLAREADLAEADPSFVAAGDVPGEEEVSGVAGDENKRLPRQRGRNALLAASHAGPSCQSAGRQR